MNKNINSQFFAGFGKRETAKSVVSRQGTRGKGEMEKKGGRVERRRSKPNPCVDHH
jgi:hypothetical protein